MNAQRTKSRPIDFANNEWDLKVALLAEAGWHTRAIAEETGLTIGQVTLRCAQAGVKRADYRNGKSDIAKFVVSTLKNRGNPVKSFDLAARLSSTIDNLQIDYIKVKKAKVKIKQRKLISA